MNKVQIYYRTEEFNALAIEITVAFKQFISEERENRIRFKFILAEAIVSSSAYQKFGKGNEDFIVRLANKVRQELKSKELPALSRTSIYDALEVYQKYPSLELLEKKLGLFATWSDALRLVGRSKESNALDCRYCPKHCPARGGL